MTLSKGALDGKLSVIRTDSRLKNAQLVLAVGSKPAAFRILLGHKSERCGRYGT